MVVLHNKNFVNLCLHFSSLLQVMGNLLVMGLVEERYAPAKTLPGTRSYHQFIPLSHSKIGAKYVSEEEQFAED